MRDDFFFFHVGGVLFTEISDFNVPLTREEMRKFS